MASRWAPVGVAAIACGSLLAAPPIAAAEVDPDSLVDEAEVVALAADGGGGSQDRDRSGRVGFSEFVRTVSARDRNSDSGRVGRADAFQDTEIIEDDGELLGVNSRGTGAATFVDPQINDGLEPSGTALSDLSVEFDVVGDPVKFSLTGDLQASATGFFGQCGRVSLTSPSGTNTTVAAAGCTAHPGSATVDETGELPPGTHTLSVEVDTEAFSGAQTGGSTTSEYDIQLRFCTLVVPEPNATTLGGSGDNVICGTPGVDTIDGQGGADRIFGLGGDDTLIGGTGSDKIDGGEGAETQIYGGPGNDTIDAGAGDDGPAAVASEVVAGGPGDDQIDGGPGADRILGRCGETLFGDFGMCPGDPVAPGESDEDNVVGGLGDDFLFGDGGADLVLGGAGLDFLNGDPGSDTIEGGPAGDSLDGGDASDQLFGEGGQDSLLGAADGDCLVGGPSRDELLGEAGDDKLLAKDGGRDTGSGGAGPDRGRFDPVDAVASVSDRAFQGGC